MPKRIPQETREEIQRLYDEGRGISLAEIALQTGVSYASVYGMTKVRQRINPETGEQFKSQTEYLTHLARQRINPETGEQFKSQSERLDYLARQRINPETGEQFKSQTEYLEYLVRQRKERKRNRELSDLVKTRLRKLGKTQSWLAQQLGVSKQAVNSYANSVSIPQGENLNKLFVALEISDKPKSLDDLVE